MTRIKIFEPTLDEFKKSIKSIDVYELKEFDDKVHGISNSVSGLYLYFAGETIKNGFYFGGNPEEYDYEKIYLPKHKLEDLKEEYELVVNTFLSFKAINWKVKKIYPRKTLNHYIDKTYDYLMKLVEFHKGDKIRAIMLNKNKNPKYKGKRVPSISESNYCRNKIYRGIEELIKRENY